MDGSLEILTVRGRRGLSTLRREGATPKRGFSPTWEAATLRVRTDGEDDREAVSALQRDHLYQQLLSLAGKGNQDWERGSRWARVPGKIPS